jgi:hypothetical protein
MISDLRKHTAEDFESQVFLISQPVGSALEDTDLIVEVLDEAESDFVFRLAVGGEPVPVSIDHLGELLVGFETLPLQLRAAVLEELPCPGFAVVIHSCPKDSLSR